MSFTRYAALDSAEVLDLKGSSKRVRTASLHRLSDFSDYRTDDNYLYARIRAQSSRTNENSDGWPSVELAGSKDILEKHKHSSDGFTIEASEGDSKYGFSSFLAKPIFVDHNNTDPKRARGVVVDAKLKVLSHKESAKDDYWSSPDADPEHLPATEIELLLEVDAKKFPLLAKAIKDGDIDGFSMGCFVAGTPITLADGTKKPIEEIVEGDRVITHKGSIEPVTFTMKRPYEGIIYEISSYGQSGAMQLTPEHPVWVRRIPSKYRDKNNENCTCKCGRTFASRRSLGYHLREVKRWKQEGEHSLDSSETIGWVEAKDVQIGDYILTPPVQSASKSDNEKFAKLLGYYLAEGNLGYDKKRFPDGRPVFVEWNFNASEEDYLTDIKNDLERFGLPVAGPYVKNNCATIRCNNPQFAEEFERLGGKYSWGKKLDPEVLLWSQNALKDVLIGYLNGDGTHSPERNIQAGTASKELAEQLYLISIKAGIRMTPPVKQHSPSMKDKEHRAKYVLQTPSVDRAPDDRTQHTAYLDSDGLWRRVNNIRLLEYAGNVYNFDVEGDDSYIANDIAVHNCDVEYSKCSHCNNIAHTPDEFCSHIISKGALHDYKTADGKRISRKSYENCYKISYFEISAVFSPADDTALTKEVISSIRKEGENPLPQEMHTKAPDGVDTLRDEQICPVCGNQMQGETCSVCGYVAPPKGFDNPDLSKAEGINKQIEQNGGEAVIPAEDASAPDEDVGNQEVQEGGVPEQGQGAPQPGSYLQRTRKSNVADDLTNDMRWKPLVHPKTAARINQMEKAIKPSSVPATNEPTKEAVIKDPQKPVTAAMLTAKRLMQSAQEKHQGENMSTKLADGSTPPDAAADKRTDVTGVGGVMDDSNDAASKADAQVNVEDKGATPVTDVEPDKKEELPTSPADSDNSGFDTDKNQEMAPHTETWNGDKGDSLGQESPVTDKAFPTAATRQSYDNKPYPDDSISDGGTVKGVQPADPIGNENTKRIDLKEYATSPANNSGPTKTWSGTDGNGVLKQQNPIGPDSLEGKWSKRLVNAFKLADAEVELGLIDKEKKYERIAEFEAQSPEEVEAQLETLARVKTAGLNKLAQMKTATKVPKMFGNKTAAPEGAFGSRFRRVAGDVPEETSASDDEVLDYALFSR